MPYTKVNIIHNETEKEAILFLAEAEIDTETLAQVKRMLHSTTVEHARVMPDCHPGVGCCVGFTSKLTCHTMPSYIGGDIGCGISVYPLDLSSDKIKKRPDKISQKIEAVVPVGTAAHETPVAGLEGLFSEVQGVAEEFALAYKLHFDTDITSYIPTYNDEWLGKQKMVWFIFQSTVDRVVLDSLSADIIKKSLPRDPKLIGMATRRN